MDTVIQKHIEELIIDLSRRHNIDVDSNLSGTPGRVCEMYKELLSGYDGLAEDVLSADFPAGEYDQMIVLKDIDFYSLCSHHMLPFFGKISVGYIPPIKGRVVGLSKLARLCQMHAKRFQLQERMTHDIANDIYKHLKPRGVGVLVHDVKHLCMLMRGVKQHTSTMSTSAVLGEFRDDPAVRAEFFSLVGK